MDTNLDVRIISLKNTPDNFKQTQGLFPQSEREKAVDMRNIDPIRLYKDGIISLSSQYTIENGRKWHHELSSTGAVGLYMSIKNALNKGNNWILLLEEDCIIKENIKNDINTLIQSHEAYNFDIVVFGPSVLSGKFKTVTDNYSMLVSGFFTGAHCILFSPTSRVRLYNLINSYAIDMQWDHYLSRLAYLDDLNVLVERKGKSAYQTLHESTIQETFGKCSLCMIPPRSWKILILVFLVIICCVIVNVRYRKLLVVCTRSHNKAT